MIRLDRYSFKNLYKISKSVMIDSLAMLRDLDYLHCQNHVELECHLQWPLVVCYGWIYAALSKRHYLFSRNSASSITISDKSLMKYFFLLEIWLHPHPSCSSASLNYLIPSWVSFSTLLPIQYRTSTLVYPNNVFDYMIINNTLFHNTT